MKSFLETVAEDLLRRYGNNLSKVAVVFPGKRASIFLDKALAEAYGGPVWSPEYTTMGNLFGELTPLVPADTIDSITTLYSIFREDGNEDMTLDKFWSWGEVILSDFDDVDKHLADAKAVFANVHDLHALDSMDFLTEEQRHTLRQFFANFTEEALSETKEKFLNTWKRMHHMYTTLKERQEAGGTLYEGALYRRVVEEMENDDTVFQTLANRYEAVAFVGFNVLNDVETRLMDTFRKRGNTLFYWDYDSYYVDIHKTHEAGIFMRKNLKEFPSAVGREHFDNLRHLSDVSFVACSSDNAAARYTREWLRQCPEDGTDSTAVVLCNESLLQPVLHALPEEGGAVNVTMGFPLTDTPVYSFVMSLLNLQTDGVDHTAKRFRASFVQTVRKHPYSTLLDETDWLTYKAQDNATLLGYMLSVTKKIALHYAGEAPDDIFRQLYMEAVFQTDRVLTKFVRQVTREDNPLCVSFATLRKLIREVLAKTSIPFHGEPAHGLQVMGVLETRCLDFRHTLMLSVEENMLPRATNTNTMIPAALREAFGLTTPRHRICVFSYYFYRLIQRTGHLTCVYNDNCANSENHEMSRFLRQILAETDIPVQTHWLKSDLLVQPHTAAAVEKDEKLLRTLRHTFDKRGGKGQTLTPTALNAWITCPMKFYLNYVAHLRKEKDPQDGIDAAAIGNIFHDTAWLVYHRLTGSKKDNKDTIEAADLQPMLDNMEETVGRILDIAFDTNIFHPAPTWERSGKALEMMNSGTHPGNEYLGTHIIERGVMMSYLRTLLKTDLRNAPFRIIGLEQDMTLCLDITTTHGDITVETGGRIDRLDITDGRIRVVDYKTGTSVPQLGSLENATTRNSGHENYCFQTFLYALAVIRRNNGKTENADRDDTALSDMPVQPVLFFPAKAYADDYTPAIKLGKEYLQDFRGIAGDFEKLLTGVVEDIFSPDKPFVQTDSIKPCQWCDFRLLCGR